LDRSKHDRKPTQMLEPRGRKMAEGTFKSIVLDGLTGCSAFLVTAILFFLNHAQNTREFALLSGSIYFAAGFYRGSKVRKRSVATVARIALGGILPAAAICNGMSRQFQTIFILFVVISVIWTGTGVWTRYVIAEGKHIQALGTGVTSFLVLFSAAYVLLPIWLGARAITWTDQPIKSFTIQTLQGNSVSSEHLKGKVVVMIFWATWCVPCQSELPQLDQLADHYHYRQDIVVLAVNSGAGGDSTEKARDFLVRRKLKLSSAIDLSSDFHVDAQGQAADSMGLNRIPTVYVLDHAGRLRIICEGYDSSENLVPSLSKAIDRLVVN
jgi:thiol-disulfide isomerase/thioredoxin